jgi:hypothetical protein
VGLDRRASPSGLGEILVVMSAYPGDRVRIDLMVRGYAHAQERYARAAEVAGPEPAYFALFEALTWAVAVDDVVAEIWRPAGAPRGLQLA